MVDFVEEDGWNCIGRARFCEYTHGIVEDNVEDYPDCQHKQRVEAYPKTFSQGKDNH